MYLQYGGTGGKFADGAVTFVNASAKSELDDSNTPVLETRRLHFKWFVQGNGQKEVNDAIALDLAKLDTHGRDIALYMDDDTKTVHFLDSQKSLNGTRIIELNANENEPAMFATQRILEIIVEADFDSKVLATVSAGGLISYSETVSTTGTGGPAVVMHNVLNSTPIRQNPFRRTPVRILQRGNAVGRDIWPTENPPLLPLDEEIVESRVISHASPLDRGKFKKTQFSVLWSYEFIQDNFLRPIRPGIK